MMKEKTQRKDKSDKDEGGDTEERQEERQRIKIPLKKHLYLLMLFCYKSNCCCCFSYEHRRESDSNAHISLVPTQGFWIRKRPPHQHYINPRDQPNLENAVYMPREHICRATEATWGKKRRDSSAYFYICCCYCCCFSFEHRRESDSTVVWPLAALHRALKSTLVCTCQFHWKLL